ncbi:MAG: ribosome silencing factor [Clostridia bacterium]|jgi:ribosome-associated protein|nr:ribosome silencing factor [Clostridia bacterium]
MTSLEKAEKIRDILDQKKALDIKVMKVGDLTIVADYFVLANGTSTTQIKSLADEVQYQLEQLSEPARLEGKTSDWLLIDSSDVIVHVFLPEAREHFNLERVWADAEEV